jgi:hypothetical protein
MEFTPLNYIVPTYIGTMQKNGNDCRRIVMVFSRKYPLIFMEGLSKTSTNKPQPG